MLPTTAITRLAAIVNASSLIGTGAGQIRSAHYPHEGIPSKYPCLQLFWDATRIEYAGDFQTWLMRVRGQLLTALMADPPREVPRVDGAIVGLGDLFDGTLNPSNFQLEQAGSTERADHCSLVEVQPSAAIAYGSFDPNHYGAELFWDVKVLRAAGTS